MEEHGLANRIRSCIDSEQFDLGGYTEARVQDLIHAAFTKEFVLDEMIKITLVVGGGKLVRSRYHDDLLKWVLASLREVGFTEDKSAAETFDSQGTYKHQHDTGQNLKFVIVFPKVQRLSSTETVKRVQDPMQNPQSLEYVIFHSDMPVFQNLVKQNTSTWKQNRNLLKMLQDQQQRLQTIESNLISGTRLSPEEQNLFDSNPGNMDQKITWVQQQMKAFVDSGNLTSEDKEELLLNLQSNIDSLTVEKDASSLSAKAKTVLEDKLSSLLQRKTRIESLPPIPSSRLKNGPEIRNLYLRLEPIRVIEERGRGSCLTIDELKIIEQRVEIENEIERLKRASLEWFQESSILDQKASFEEQQARLSYSQKSKSNKPSSSSNSLSKSGSSSSSSSPWSTSKSTSKSSSSSQSKKSYGKGGGGGGGSFAAAFGGDSDDD